MSTWVIGASIAAALLAVALGILLVRMLSYRRPVSSEDIPPEFSLSRYQPMTQIMSGEDAQFLCERPVVSPTTQKRFKRNRRRIFRLYLRELTADFEALHGRAREIVADSPEGNSELIGSLVRLQFDFWRFLTLIEVQLVLDQLGLGTVDSARLLAVANSLHTSVARESGSSGPVMV